MEKQKHTCTKCNKEFEEYRINRDCSCNDGFVEDDDGYEERCMRCDGSGCDDSIEKSECKKCRFQYDDEDY